MRRDSVTHRRQQRSLAAPSSEVLLPVPYPTPMTTKRHDNVLRDIDVLMTNGDRLPGAATDSSSDLRDFSFQQVGAWFREIRQERKDGPGHKTRSFDLTRDGFTLLVMGWTGERPMRFRVAYIQAFNAMEVSLRANGRTSASWPPCARSWRRWRFAFPSRTRRSTAWRRAWTASWRTWPTSSTWHTRGAAPLSEATRRYFSATALMKVSVKQAPSLVLATDMVPPMAPIVRRTTVSPMPVPRPTALVV
jgi:Rha family phage regulatory protein